MLSNLLEALYNKVIVNIVIKRSSCDVYIELCSKKATIDHTKKTFNTTTLTEEIIDFITSYTKESPYSYLSILDTSSDQGAIPTCSKSNLSYYQDLSASEYKCFNEKWVYYTSKSDLNEIEKNYKKIGVDFIFSPFTLLCKFFADKVNSSLALYILVQDSYLSLSVFENSQLIFAEHLDMETSIDDEVLSQSMDDDEIDLSDSNVLDIEAVDVIEDMEDLEDFGDIEDLDSLEEIDEFSESQDIEEEFYEAEEPIVESDDDSFNEDYQRFALIQSSLGHFYKDTHYESQFVESVYIADGAGVSSDLKRYLEEEMFLNVYIRHLDIAVEMCSLAKEELGL